MCRSFADVYVGQVAEFNDSGKLRRGKVRECVLKDGAMYVEVVYKVVNGANSVSVMQARVHVSKVKIIGG